MIAPNETAPNFKQIMKYSQPSVICTAIEQCVVHVIMVAL